MQWNIVNYRYVNQRNTELTLATALSRVSEAPPPKDIEATEGLPFDWAWLMTKLRPETLYYS
jgi:hypothetical protein